MSHFFLSAVLICLFTTVAAAEDTMQITSDTPGYCIGLARRLDERADLPAEVRSLSVEGLRMCQSGHVHGGLARLRRAMLLQRAGER